LDVPRVVQIIWPFIVIAICVMKKRTVNVLCIEEHTVNVCSPNLFVYSIQKMAKTDVRKLTKKYGCLLRLNDGMADDDNRNLVAEPIQKTLRAVRNLRKKVVDALQTAQRFETKQFWSDMARSNLLTFLYSCGDAMSAEDEQGTLLLEQIKKTLEKDPQNITALVTQMKVHIDGGNTCKAKKILARLKALEGDEDETIVQSIKCDSEVAFAYSHVHPTLYGKAVEKYKAVIDRYERESKQKPIVREKLLCQTYGWYYQLAVMYNRGLNKGISPLMHNGSPCDVIAVYREICDRLKYVIDTEDATPFRGRAMILLVQAYRKFSTLTPEGSIAFPYDDAPDSFVERAYELSRTDPSVVESYAEQYRQRAHNEETFLRAVSLFKEALELHPNRHVTLHHKGRAHRSLWLETGDYKEAKLHRNSERRGNKQWSYTKQKHTTKTRWNPDKSNASVESTHARRLAESSPLKNEATEKNVSLSTPPQAAPASFPPVRPTYPTTSFGRAPEQGRQPHFFDTLRVSNPRVDDANKKSEQHLLAAEDCFKKACELTHNVSCPYLVDLGRVLISLGRYDEALSKFETAKKLGSSVDDNDGAYLHEQLAMLRQQMLDETAPDHDDQVEDVMALYREAIRAATAAKTRSKIAFYQLRDILRERMSSDPENKAFSMEYEVLYNTIDRHHSCKDELLLIEALRQDADTCETAIWLVKYLVERNLKNDAFSAFVYISALQKAGKLDVENEDEDARKDLRKVAVKIAREMNREKSDQNDAPDREINEEESSQNDAPNYSFIFGLVLRWFIGEKTMTSRGFNRESDDSGPYCLDGPFDVCVLAPSGDSPTVGRLVELLESHMHLRLCRFFFDGDDDNIPGTSVFDGTLISRSVSVCVVDDRQHCKWNVMKAILEELLLNSSKSNVFLVSNENIDPPSDRLFDGSWHRFKINNEKSLNYLACELLNRASLDS